MFIVLESIKKHCEKNLAIYSWPYEYEFREELPMEYAVELNKLLKNKF